MPSRFERYRAKDGVTVLGERYFNPVFQDIDLRLSGLEGVRIAWEEAVRTVSEFGLLRINEAIGPSLDEANAKIDDIETLRQAAIAALADLQTAINDFEQNAAADLAAWKDSITPSLPSLATALQLSDVSARVTTLENTPAVTTITYDNRANLRSGTPIDGQTAVVDGLGLFTFFVGSDEPDDDESCFATATGRWLLECPHWDVVSLWQLPDDAVRDEYDEDEPLRFASSFASRFASKVLSGTATCAITSVASVSSASFTGAVTGASVGDRVIATPPAALGATAAETGRLSYHAWVSAANTVTVMLTNGSAAAANTNAAILAAWPITVIKS